jgi:hypothetical protein
MAGSADDQQVGAQFVRQVDNGSHRVASPQMGLKLHLALFRHPACLLKHAVEAARCDPGLLPDLFDVLRRPIRFLRFVWIGNGKPAARSAAALHQAARMPSCAGSSPNSIFFVRPMLRSFSSKSVERHEFVRRRAEEMPPEFRELFARLRGRAVSHL